MLQQKKGQIIFLGHIILSDERSHPLSILAPASTFASALQFFSLQKLSSRAPAPTPALRISYLSLDTRGVPSFRWLKQSVLTDFIFICLLLYSLMAEGFVSKRLFRTLFYSKSCFGFSFVYLRCFTGFEIFIASSALKKTKKKLN